MIMVGELSSLFYTDKIYYDNIVRFSCNEPELPLLSLSMSTNRCSGNNKNRNKQIEDSRSFTYKSTKVTGISGNFVIKSHGSSIKSIPTVFLFVMETV